MWARIIDGCVDIISFPKPVQQEGELWIESDSNDICPGMTWDGNNFSAPERDAEVVKRYKIEELRMQCSLSIVGGFSSAALGTERQYGSDTNSQSNMANALIEASVSPSEGWHLSIWCAQNGNWEFITHDLSQVKQVFSDCRAHIVQCQSKLAELRLSIEQHAEAGDLAAIDATNW